MNYGLLADVLDSSHWLFGDGNIASQPVQPDGHWIVLPVFQPQSKGALETWNCTGVAACNALEMLIRTRFQNTPLWSDEYLNLSERFVGIVSGTVPGAGNSPHAVAEAIRKNGIVSDSVLPFDDSIQSNVQYFSPKPPTPDLIAKAKEFLDKFVFGHDWVDANPQAMMDALKYSPLTAAVFAWKTNDKGMFVKDGQDPYNHDVAIMDYKEGEYWIAFDSYLRDGQPLKQLAWDYPFSMVKRYSLDSRAELMKKEITLMQALIMLYTQLKAKLLLR